MWEFLEDWFSQLQHQIEMRLSRLVRDVNSSASVNSPESRSPVEMGNGLLGSASPPSDGFDRIRGLLDQLSGLHSDEYKAKHPEISGGHSASDPVHVVVDNHDEMSPVDQPKGPWSRLEGLMDRLKGLHSNEYKNAHPEMFDSPTFDVVPPVRTTSTQRAGNWISAGGRFLQSASGRLWQSSVPGSQMAASMASRTGSLMQTVGGALSAGGPAAAAVGTTAAIVGLPLLAAGFVAATKKMGEGLLDSQRQLAMFNGSIANTIAMTDVSRMRMDMRLASATSESTAALGRSMRELRETLQPLREMFYTLGIEVVNVVVKMANFTAEAAAAVVPGGDLMMQLWDRRQQNQPPAIAPGLQFMQSLQRQQAAPRPPLRPIP